MLKRKVGQLKEYIKKKKNCLEERGTNKDEMKPEEKGAYDRKETPESHDRVKQSRMKSEMAEPRS